MQGQTPSTQYILYVSGMLIVNISLVNQIRKFLSSLYVFFLFSLFHFNIKKDQVLKEHQESPSFDNLILYDL